MADQLDKEIDAIKAVLHALEPLPPEVRNSVLGYILGRLQIELSPIKNAGLSSTPPPSENAPLGMAKAEVEQQTGSIHIKNMKEEKKPRSASEMAAIVAY